MTFSPSDTPEIQKERVLRIVATINSLVRDSLINQRLKSQLDSTETFTVPLVYFRKAEKVFIEGEIYLTLQKLSFIQKYVKDHHLKLLPKVSENYSFSIDTIAIYECKQQHSADAKKLKHFSEVILSSQGSTLSSPSASFGFFFPKQEYVFGAYTADAWNSEKTVHYGSGETFLFKLRPEKKKYSWTRLNDDFMLSTKEAFISLGSGGKGVGLWVDEDLLYGSSNRSETFNNDVLGHSVDFKVMELEVWSPVRANVAAKPKVVNATDFFGTTFSYKPPPKAYNPYGY
eukprot:gene17961-21434_t